jgi:hypothetical protein
MNKNEEKADESNPSVTLSETEENEINEKRYHYSILN